MKSLKLLKLLLVLMALHSFFVGLGLVLIPVEQFDFFGFHNYQGHFFKLQGGVFHLIMALIYMMAAGDPVQNRNVLYIIIIAKFTATVFLLGFYFFGDRAWMVLVSGLGDFLMGLAVILLARSLALIRLAGSR